VVFHGEPNRTTDDRKLAIDFGRRRLGRKPRRHEGAQFRRIDGTEPTPAKDGRQMQRDAALEFPFRALLFDRVVVDDVFRRLIERESR
jgi:hypothetical protein